VGGGRTIDTTIIQYNKWGFFIDFQLARHTFQVILESSGHITFNYLNIDSLIAGPPNYSSAGIENSSGTIGLQVDFLSPGTYGHIKDSTSIRISPPDSFACPVGIEENSDFGIRIAEFGLMQNFPNPFSRLTTISYKIPSLHPASRIPPASPSGRNHVSLNIYDLSGRLIETLVNEPQEPGVYQLSITSNQLPSSGIYFYRLNTRIGQAFDFTTTKKMILLR
jgi:hypothetical protein